MGGIMIGTFEDFELAFGSFGQQYTTIDGKKYITFFDLADPRLRGLVSGVRVEYEARPGPTVLCDSPRVEDNLPSATLARVMSGGAE